MTVLLPFKSAGAQAAPGASGLFGQSSNPFGASSGGGLFGANSGGASK